MKFFLKIKGRSKLVQVIFIVLLSIPVFYSSIYRILINFVDISWSYIIDQFFPLALTVIIAFLVIKKKVFADEIKYYVLTNWLPILVITIVSLIVHGWTINNYFSGEGWGTLRILNEPVFAQTGPGVSSNIILAPIEGSQRGWHAGVMALSYVLFFTKVELYNLLNLILYILTSIILYIFLNQLFRKTIISPLVGILFFVTTPAYMDIFPDLMNSSGMPISLAAGILSLIFLSFYQKSSKFVCYLISLLFYLSALKISFVRLHPFVILPLFMCLFPGMSLRSTGINIRKFTLFAAPFLCIFLCYLLVVFILPDHIFEKILSIFFPGSKYADIPIIVHGDQLNTNNYLISFIVLVAYLFIPSQFAESYYPHIKEFLSQIPFVPNQINLTLIFGTVALSGLTVVGFISIRNMRKSWGRLNLFALVAVFANLVLTPFFTSRYGDLTELDKQFSLSSSGFGPGSRYVFVSAIGISILFAQLTSWIISKYKKHLYIFLTFVAALFIYYAFLDISNHIYYVSKESNPGRVIPDSVFSMVPKDGKKKLLYSTNPANNSIDTKPGGGAAWLYIFYKLKELDYTNSLEEVKNKVVSGEYAENNFYAFYNNPTTLTFKDVSEIARSEFYGNKLNTKNQLVENVRLIAFSDLNRGIYISRELNQIILSPWELSISISKNWLPPKDTNTVKQELEGGKEPDFYKKVLQILTNNQNPDEQLFSVLYACAEDSDWIKQIQTQDVVGGIWYAEEFILDDNYINEVKTEVTCYGSKLRQLILIGPSISGEIFLKSITLK